MPQPRFDRLNFNRLAERLLAAGIAPRHVRRYMRELSDHFDDLVREEKAAGAARELAETRALSRLGNDEDLAQAMLSKPELRSLAARFPWAVFGIGPIVMLAASLAGALYLEFWLLHLPGGIFSYWTGQPPGPVTAKLATQVYTVYNTLIVYGGPLLFAWLFYRIGARQRMPANWIMLGVGLVCILGGFQNLIFYDTGCRGCGNLLVESAIIPPFSHFAEGLARAAMNLAIAGGVWWAAARQKASSAMELHTARM